MGNKKGLIIALVALVAVVALAGIAYGALAPKAADTANDAAVATSGSEVQSTSSSGAASASDQVLADLDATDVHQLTDFTVTDFEGNSIKLSSMQGKPTFVGFWATWCPPCNQEAPEIQKLYEQYGDRVNFMMIDFTDGQRETTETVTEWIEQNGYNYPVYLDTTGEAVMDGRVQYFPTTYLLDAEGNTVFSTTGVITVESGSHLFESVLQ